jgi:hypothetical protein
MRASWRQEGSPGTLWGAIVDLIWRSIEDTQKVVFWEY